MSATPSIAVLSENLGLRPLGMESSAEGAMLFRSRTLHFADAEDIRILVSECGVKSIYDIRSSREVGKQAEVYPLGTKTIALLPASAGRPKEAGKWLRAGVIGRYGAPGERMLANYRSYVDDYPIIGAALRGIATEGVPALIHCENGKDRTGVMSAVILYAAGAPWETIMADYLATNEVNAAFIAKEEARLGEGMTDDERAILMSFLEARPEYLEAFFAEAEVRYGSLERYLSEGLRLTSAQRANLSMLARVDAAVAPADMFWRQSQRAKTRLEGAAFWDAKAADYDKTSAEDGFLTEILPLLDVRAHESVLDMGCGTGELAISLAKTGHGVIAADFSDGMLGALRGKLAAEAKDLPLRSMKLSWDDDWEAAGLGPGCVDVALAIRSFSTEHMGACLAKMDAAAQRRAVIVINTGHSPRIMPEVYEAAGLAFEESADDKLIMAELRRMGRTPEHRIFTQSRQRCFAGPAEARQWVLRMVTIAGVNPAAPENEPLCTRLEKWLDAHLVAGADPTRPFALAVPQTNNWAVISWECHQNDSTHAAHRAVASA